MESQLEDKSCSVIWQQTLLSSANDHRKHSTLSRLLQKWTKCCFALKLQLTKPKKIHLHTAANLQCFVIGHVSCDSSDYAAWSLCCWELFSGPNCSANSSCMNPDSRGIPGRRRRDSFVSEQQSHLLPLCTQIPQ